MSKKILMLPEEHPYRVIVERNSLRDERDRLREELARLRADSAELARVRGATVISKVLPELDKASGLASQLVGNQCYLDPSKHYRIDFVMLGEPAEIKQSIPEGFVLVPVEVKRDAERYQWLCKQAAEDSGSVFMDRAISQLSEWVTPKHEIDSTIDAAPKGDSHE